MSIHCTHIPLSALLETDEILDKLAKESSSDQPPSPVIQLSSQPDQDIAQTDDHPKQQVTLYSKLSIINFTPSAYTSEFHHGRLVQSTYEFYNPNVVARKLGCGQLPPSSSSQQS
jgi:hypothetical protein